MSVTPRPAGAAAERVEVAAGAPRPRTTTPTGPGVAISPREREQRKRLRNAVIEEVAKRGYSTTTVSDIVRTARVSRSTFYELYDGKEDCFLDAYASLQRLLLRTVMNLDPTGADPEELLVRGVDAYLDGLFVDVRAHQAFQKEILVAGPAGARAKRQAFESWAQLLHRRISDVMARQPRLARGRLLASEPVIYASLIGINELVVRAIDDGAVRPSPALRRDVMRVMAGMVSRDAEQEVRWIDAALPLVEAAR